MLVIYFIYSSLIFKKIFFIVKYNSHTEKYIKPKMYSPGNDCKVTAVFLPLVETFELHHTSRPKQHAVFFVQLLS